jgi:hypothetical protein
VHEGQPDIDRINDHALAGRDGNDARQWLADQVDPSFCGLVAHREPISVHCSGPEHGWAISHRTASGPLSFYAGPGASPLDLIPTQPQVLNWAVGELDGNGAPPAGVDLDEDPEAIQRLLGFRDLCSGF